MAKLLNSDGMTDSVTPSTHSLNQNLGTSPGPRTLSASEISLLRQSKVEIRRSSKDGKFVIATSTANDPFPTPQRKTK